MKGPGGRFEAEVQASIPRKSRGGRPLSIEKRHDPPTRGTAGRCRRCKGQLLTVCASCRQAPKGAARFTARQPYDFEVVAPAGVALRAGVDEIKGTAGRDGSAWWPSIVFAFECKRTAAASLPFSAIADHQRKGLARIAAAGGVAGVLWLIERPGWPAACWCVPWPCLERYEETALRKSLPASALPEVKAVKVEVDPDRGRSRRYWRLADLLRRFGADV